MPRSLCWSGSTEPRLRVGWGRDPTARGNTRGYGPGRAELVGMSRPGQRPANTLSQGHGPRGPATLLTEERETDQVITGLRPALCIAEELCPREQLFFLDTTATCWRLWYIAVVMIGKMHIRICVILLDNAELYFSFVK